MVQKRTAEHGMERVPLYASEMGISIQHHMMRQLYQVLMWFYIIGGIVI